MRILNVLRNSMYALVSYAMVALLGIIIRKLFVQYLQIEFLGLEGLFSNIISLLSLAELGIGSIISYGLYRELADKNEKEINLLMNIYRYIYMLIGGFIFIVGVVLFFFLPFIIRDSSVSWYYVQLVYIIQIATVLSSYFLAYKRTLFIADQKEYISIKIDMGCFWANSIIKLCAIVFFQSYTLYAVSGLFFNILANLLISRCVSRKYTFLYSVKVTWKQLQDRNFFVDVRNFLVHKISYIIYGGTDAIVVSSLLGLKVAGILANYVLIQNGVYQILYKCLQGIIPSLGNMLYDKEKEKSYNLYLMLDLLYYFIGGHVCCLYVIALQPFMALFFGPQFLLEGSFVVALAINAFISMQFENAYNFRSTCGSFENDRKYMMMSASINLVISILLVKFIGIVGVMIGTILGLLCIVYGRVQFVFRIIFNRDMKMYLLRHFFYTLLTGGEIFVIYYICRLVDIPNSYSGIIVKCLLSVTLMSFLQIMFFYKTKEFKEIMQYIQKIKGIVKKNKS